MNRPLSIVNAPYPFPTESAASWIHRVCQLHGLTYKALTSFLGIKACRDPDVAEPRHFVCFIGLGTGISGKRLQELADVFHAVRLHPPSKTLLNYHDGAPSYRFCPQCIATDLVPYLRIEWRFKDWTVCPKHQVKMLERCPHCGAPILGTMPCLGMSADDEALGVGHCTFCERPLATTTEGYPQTWVSPTKLKVQNAIVSAVRRGGLRLEGYYWPVSLDFILWLRDNPELVKSCFERRARCACPEESKYGVAYLIDEYGLERRNKKTAEEILDLRTARDRKRWATWADKCYEATIKRQRSLQATTP
ncbi:TniQ family protein [Ralstonia pseudosolanacearum]